jgi:3-methyladenine DNA glycosylase AlkC
MGNEVIIIFDSKMGNQALHVRKGARRTGDVPAEVLASLSTGADETVNLMEWLAADMSTLARAVAGESSAPLRDALLEAADQMSGCGVTERLRLAGSAIVRGVPELAGPEFERLAAHRSDLVRQWACYAVNDAKLVRALADRLRDTSRFASDKNMSVREAAWMAFRPHLAQNLSFGLQLLEPLSRGECANERRFAIEVTRPRSVWGAHLVSLKREPEQALALLEATKGDNSRYVQLAVGNWLNDASKSRPDWVSRVCALWSKEQNRCTDFIVKRGLRTIIRTKAWNDSGERLF